MKTDNKKTWAVKSSPRGYTAYGPGMMTVESRPPTTADEERIERVRLIYDDIKSVLDSYGDRSPETVISALMGSVIDALVTGFDDIDSAVEFYSQFLRQAVARRLSDDAA